MKNTRSYILVLSMLMAACAVGQDFTAPKPPSTQNFTPDGDQVATSEQHTAPGIKIAPDWWTTFRSDRLNDVEQQALAGNHDLAAMKSTLAQAQEESKAAAGALYPNLSLGGTAGRQKYGKAMFGPSDFQIPPFTYYSVGPQVSYLIDFAGGSRRNVEEKEAVAESEGYQAAAAKLTLTGNVMAQVIGIVSAKVQIQNIQSIIADDQKNLDLVNKAFAAGAGTKPDVLAAESQLAADQTLLPPLKQQLSVATHALAILVGKAPGDWQAPAFTPTEFHLPSELPLTLPSALVHDRPDIMAAEAQLHAASAAIGVATANMYPSITLTANTTQQALSPEGLFNPASNAWALAAGLTAPIFNGGQLQAEKSAAEQAYQTALSNYQQTVLESFGQVANVLKALQHDDEQIKAQQRALDTAEQSLKLSRVSYDVGNSGVLPVLEAERHMNEARLGMTRAKTQQFQDTALLYLALGGGALAQK